jgi:hypothetical protein
MERKSRILAICCECQEKEESYGNDCYPGIKEKDLFPGWVVVKTQTLGGESRDYNDVFCPECAKKRALKEIK